MNFFYYKTYILKVKILKKLSNLLDQNIKKSDQENIIPENIRSIELEWKLALLVRNIDDVEDIDLKFVSVSKIDVGTKKDLFTSYRLDFNGREKLNQFKKKYKNILL